MNNQTVLRFIKENVYRWQKEDMRSTSALYERRILEDFYLETLGYIPSLLETFKKVVYQNGDILHYRNNVLVERSSAYKNIRLSIDHKLNDKIRSYTQNVLENLTNENLGEYIGFAQTRAFRITTIGEVRKAVYEFLGREKATNERRDGRFVQQENGSVVFISLNPLDNGRDTHYAYTLENPTIIAEPHRNLYYADIKRAITQLFPEEENSYLSYQVNNHELLDTERILIFKKIHLRSVPAQAVNVEEVMVLILDIAGSSAPRLSKIQNVPNGGIVFPILLHFYETYYREQSVE